MLVSFLQTHGGKELLITSRSGVLIIVSDNNKDESSDIIIHAHGEIHLFIKLIVFLPIKKTHTRLRHNFINLAFNENKTSDNMDATNICHPEK